jgi:hypothetical protein
MVRTFGYILNIAFVAKAPVRVSDVLGAIGDYPVASQCVIWGSCIRCATDKIGTY